MPTRYPIDDVSWTLTELEQRPPAFTLPIIVWNSGVATTAMLASTELIDPSHTQPISNVVGLQDALDNKQDKMTAEVDITDANSGISTLLTLAATTNEINATNSKINEILTALRNLGLLT